MPKGGGMVGFKSWKTRSSAPASFRTEPAGTGRRVGPHHCVDLGGEGCGVHLATPEASSLPARRPETDGHSVLVEPATGPFARRRPGGGASHLDFVERARNSARPASAWWIRTATLVRQERIVARGQARLVAVAVSSGKSRWRTCSASRPSSPHRRQRQRQGQ